MRSPEFAENNAFTQSTVLNERAQLSSQCCCVSFFFFSFFFGPFSFLPRFWHLLLPPSPLAEDLSSFLLEKQTIRWGPFCSPTSLSHLQTDLSYYLSSSLSLLSWSKIMFLSDLCWSFQITWLCVGSPLTPPLPCLFPGQFHPHTKFLNCIPSSDLPLGYISKCWLNTPTHIPHGFLRFSMSKGSIFISLWKVCSFLCLPHCAE